MPLEEKSLKQLYKYARKTKVMVGHQTENVCRGTGAKNNQMQILEPKSIVVELKYSQDGLRSRSEVSEGQISEFEHKSQAMTPFGDGRSGKD